MNQAMLTATIAGASRPMLPVISATISITAAGPSAWGKDADRAIVRYQ
jgi:hypothetical protein